MCFQHTYYNYAYNAYNVGGSYDEVRKPFNNYRVYYTAEDFIMFFALPVRVYKTILCRRHYLHVERTTNVCTVLK
jgi:hypothetical protein